MENKHHNTICVVGYPFFNTINIKYLCFISINKVSLFFVCYALRILKDKQLQKNSICTNNENQDKYTTKKQREKK